MESSIYGEMQVHIYNTQPSAMVEKIYSVQLREYNT
jgi:hypothetical protein